MTTLNVSEINPQNLSIRKIKRVVDVRYKVINEDKDLIERI